MYISVEGNVVGSVNRAELAAAYKEATDETVRANLAAAGAEHGMFVEGGRLVDPSTPEPEPGSEPEPEPVRPAINDNKATWIDFAVSQGLDRELAEAATKAELIEDYGE